MSDTSRYSLFYMTNKISYRPEIDGLRALAVVSVIIYHAEFSIGSDILLKGGFFGVDVFFVISGFLITSLILREVRKTGEFSLTGFYERRARRLLPALLLVMLVSVFYAYKYLFPTQLVDYAKSILASLAFVANVYWDVSLQEYGAESGALKPFLHTWSLAVEEQYYIFFPIIFVALYKRMQAKTLYWMGSALLISLLYAEWMTQRDASFSFYQLPTRLWELLAGGILGFVLLIRGNKSLFSDHGGFRYLARLMPKVGLALMTYSFVFIGFDDSHPGFVTLIPVAATLLIIAFARKGELITRLLSSRPFVFVGLISYSLYLWHYPIFAFTRVRGGRFTENQDKLEFILLALFLATLSTFFVERIFRNRQVVPLKAFVVSIVALVIIIISTSSYIVYKDVSKERFTDLVALYGENEFDNDVLRIESVEIVKNPPAQARFNPQSGKTKIFIIGNSHAKDLYNAFVQNLDLFSQYEFEHVGMGIGASDQRFNTMVTNNPLFQMADVVVLSNRYALPDKKYKGDVAVLASFIDKIHSLGKKIVVTSNTVEFIEIEGKWVFDWYVQNSRLFNRQELKSLFYNSINPNIKIRTNDAVAEIAREKGVVFLDKSLYLCDHNLKQCDGVTPDGYKSFYDYGHYTLHGAKHFGERIYETNWFKLD